MDWAKRAVGAMRAGIVGVLCAGAAPAASRAASEPTTELPAGGLVFTSLNVIRTLREEVVIGIDRVRVNYVVRNNDTVDRTLTVAFPLPDIDMAALDGASVIVPGYDPANPTNFLGFWTLVEGQSVQPEVDRRALALGVADVTDVLGALAVPVYPFAPELADKLNALPPATKSDLAARSIAHFNDDEFAPLWTLRTGFFWRQAFPAGRPLTVQHGYQPIAGSALWTAETAAGLAQRFCVDKTSADTLTRRAAAGEAAPVYWVQFLAAAGAQLRGSVASYKITIEKPSEKSIATTCRQGFTPAGATSLVWQAADHIPEEDIAVMFVE